VNAVKEMASFGGEFRDKVVAWMGDAGNGIHDLYVGIFHANEINTDKLCVTDANGKTCITRSQLDAILLKAGQPVTTYGPTSSTQIEETVDNTASSTESITDTASSTEPSTNTEATSTSDTSNSDITSPNDNTNSNTATETPSVNATDSSSTETSGADTGAGN